MHCFGASLGMEVLFHRDLAFMFHFASTIFAFILMSNSFPFFVFFVEFGCNLYEFHLIFPSRQYLHSLDC